MDTVFCSERNQPDKLLLPDIPVFKGHDFTHLEDWLADIETVADLAAESRTKLAQAKSKGLT